jgi:hypothetical protein
MDRRQYRRAMGVVDSVQVTARHKTQTFRVESLSAGGASIRGEIDLRVGERIKLALVIDGRTETMAADVTRFERGADGCDLVGIAFRHPAERLVDRIEELVMAALERQRMSAPATVLIVDPREERGLALERDVKSIGFSTRRAVTTFEATRCLDDFAVRYEAVVIGNDPAADPLQFIVYLQLAHTRLQRVLVTAADDPELAHRAHATLPEPWQLAGLTRALSERREVHR